MKNRLDRQLQPRKPVDGDVPDSLAVHIAVAVNQQIAETDDVSQIWNFLGQLWRTAVNLVQGFSDRDETALDSQLRWPVTDIGFQTPAIRKELDVLSSDLHMMKQDSGVTLHRQARASG